MQTIKLVVRVIVSVLALVIVSPLVVVLYAILSAVAAILLFLCIVSFPALIMLPLGLIATVIDYGIPCLETLGINGGWANFFGFISCSLILGVMLFFVYFREK